MRKAIAMFFVLVILLGSMMAEFTISNTNAFELGFSLGANYPRGLEAKIEIGNFKIGFGKYLGMNLNSIFSELYFISFGRGKSGYFYFTPGLDFIWSFSSGIIGLHGMIGYRWNISKNLFLDIAGGFMFAIKDQEIITPPIVDLAIGWMWGL